MAFEDQIDYQIEFAQHADFSDAVQTVSAESYIALKNLVPGTRYFFRVRARGAEGGPGNWSDATEAVVPSKREALIALIIERMRQIKPENGYQTGLGASVHDFETNFADEDLPALSVCDLVSEHELAGKQATATGQIDKYPVYLKIFARSNTRASDLRKMISDIWKAVKVDPRWENLAMQTIPLRSGIELSEEAFTIGGAMVAIEVHIFNTNFGS